MRREYSVRIYCMDALICYVCKSVLGSVVGSVWWAFGISYLGCLSGYDYSYVVDSDIIWKINESTFIEEICLFSYTSFPTSLMSLGIVTVSSSSYLILCTLRLEPSLYRARYGLRVTLFCSEAANTILWIVTLLSIYRSMVLSGPDSCLYASWPISL